ncbi:small nuclear ribonucleoprotein F (nucleomorph) [Lotharella oceanica]|uniref:Small nuclear ribonucleoprotein F n=1 Tax=Lotharella oceanica TaxID=641309 RepID=A0A060D7V7_9EUKA|nr:small nuclear ribonucleoprotein F [Lotharella oceanica]|mmetsp:Transcript_4144/g.7956  ORF Transcript_4144/g.7956 Transcript_4144/m.7956 type:complete len:95 (+) Transcript_4144:159-443(+)
MRRACNPKPLLKDSIGEVVQIKLKNFPIIYKGYLISLDDWMNIHLVNTEEIINNINVGKMGEVFIKCTNIAFILIDKRVLVNYENENENKSKFK